jgi:hypothetical protein
MTMAGWMKRLAVIGLICSGSGAVAAGCAHNDESIFIRQVQSPGSDCSVLADPSGKFLGLGTMDLMFSSEYRAALLVGSQLVQRGSTENVRAESARVTLYEAEVHIVTPDDSELGAFTIPGNGFIDPATGIIPGWGLFETVLVDVSTSVGILGRLCQGSSGCTDGVPTGRLDRVGRIIAKVKVYGRTLGGTEIETGEFKFPIETCFGCSILFPSEAEDPTLNRANCLKTGSTTSSGSSSLCRVGQDGYLDCRTCHALFGSADSRCEP